MRVFQNTNRVVNSQIVEITKKKIINGKYKQKAIVLNMNNKKKAQKTNNILKFKEIHRNTVSLT